MSSNSKIYLGFEIIDDFEEDHEYIRNMSKQSSKEPQKAPIVQQLQEEEKQEEDEAQNHHYHQQENKLMNEDEIKMVHKNIPLIHCISFSQSGKTVGIGTAEGLRVQSTENHSNKYVLEENQNYFKCGIKLISLLYDTFMCAVVTDNKNKSYPDSNVYIFDSIRAQIIAEYEFHQTVTSLQYMREFLLVSSYKRILLYDIVNKHPLKYILDVQKPATFSASQYYDTFSYAYLQEQTTNLVVWNVWYAVPVTIDLRQDFTNNNEFTLKDVKQEDIQNIVFSPDGSLLSIVEKGGIKIKIFETYKGQLRCTLFRGKVAKKITDIQISSDNSVLGLISTLENSNQDEGTVHLFDISTLKDSKAAVHLCNLKSQQFSFQIMKRHSYSLKDNKLTGPFIRFDQNEKSFTIYTDSDQKISQKYDLSVQKPKQKLDVMHSNDWIEEAQYN